MKRKHFISMLLALVLFFFFGCTGLKITDQSLSEASVLPKGKTVIEPYKANSKKPTKANEETVIEPYRAKTEVKPEQEVEKAETEVEQKQQVEQSLVASAQNDTVNETAPVPTAAPKSGITLEMVYKLAKKNQAGVKQLNKAVNELSVMALLSNYGKGKIVALRYRFGYGGSKLSALATEDLTGLKTLEKEEKIEVVLFEGYSDDTGNLSKNKELAKARAENGRKFYSADINSAAQAIGKGSVNLHGLKKDSRCLIVYVKVITGDIGFRRY